MRHAIRLGGGATVPAGENLVAQCRFLDAVARRVPQAFEDLARLASQPPRGRPQAIGWLDNHTEQELQRWACRWGFPQPAGWWIRQARHHVTTWRAHPDRAGTWLGAFGTYREPRWPTLRWNANEEAEADFDRRVAAYKARVKALPGVTLTPTTFRPIDFDALALEHVAQLTISDVLARLSGHLPESLEESTIRKRNAALAQLLGLTLRRRRGRRPTENRKK